jgi:hypothetical protein
MGNMFKQWLIVAFLVTDGIGLAAFGWSRLSSVEELAGRGVATTGKVIDHASSQYSKRSPSYSLTVEFLPTNSAKLTKTLEVDGTTYRSAVNDGSVKVRYLPDNPSRCAAGQMATLPYRVLLVFGLGILGVGLLLLGWILRRAGI